ncbi:hypothetical protein SANA_22650 [Gottschalkiaceae bacterium SANA]|nr:hypothetical protein SANA_22650 [Gottschalkiaceae bacterium SANA]
MKLMEELFEVIRESVNENFKAAIKYVLLLMLGPVSNFIESIKSIEITIKLPIIIGFVAVVTILVIKMFDLKKKNGELKLENEELQNPANDNVNKFKPGEVVILRIEENLSSPRKLSVIRKTKSEIVCRDNKCGITNYSPEELLTSSETDQVFQKIEYERQITEQRNQEIIKQLNTW